MGDILVNSPPETLKYLMAEGLRVPKFVLLPPDVPEGQKEADLIWQLDKLKIAGR